MAANYSLNYIETSAKTDSNVFEAFLKLTKEIMKKGLVADGKEGESLSEKPKENKKKGCCKNWFLKKNN